MRLNQLARQLNVAPETIVNYLHTQQVEIVDDPNTKLLPKQVTLLQKHFTNKPAPAPAKKIEKEPPPPQKEARIVLEKPHLDKVKAQSASSAIQKKNQDTPISPIKKTEKPLAKLKVLGKIDMPVRGNTEKVAQFLEEQKKQRRSNMIKHVDAVPKPSLTTPKITTFAPSSFSSYGKKKPRREKFDISKRRNYREQKQERHTLRKKRQNRGKILRVTEFSSPHELAPLLGIPLAELIDICLNLGMEVAISQRLNKEAISIIAEELEQKVEFVTLDEELNAEEQPDNPKDLQPIAPVVTIMGHVDHGKTSLLDYIRKTKLINKEAGGITQHIGAYDVTMPDGHRIVFLDTPGHEAFTAMRARGADITNVAIIIIAANDGVKPQTKEAISHAQLAGIPIVIAINKIDHPEADAEKVKSQLSDLNILVEEWGGKYQCQPVSAKTGEGVNELLEKVILEAEVLELKANPKKKAKGTVIEAELAKGRGYVATVMVQEGTLRRGDILVAGPFFGKVKAIFTAQGTTLKEAGPATPVQVLGLDGAPSAGQVCRVMSSDKEARGFATRYKNILHDQRLSAQHKYSIKKQKENLFKEDKTKTVSILIKGDVSGSVEAIADALMGLSTDDIEVKVIYKAVGPVTESDVLLASTSSSVIIAFHTKVTPQALQAQKNEKVTIVSHNIIYEAIEYIKKMIEDMDEPEALEPTVIGRAEVRKIFKISRLGTIAGCYVKEGVIKRNETVRFLREGKPLYEGPIKQLKREKDVIKEAKNDTECGILADNFNDIEVGDIIECIGIPS